MYSHNNALYESGGKKRKEKTINTHTQCVNRKEHSRDGREGEHTVLKPTLSPTRWHCTKFTPAEHNVPGVIKTNTFKQLRLHTQTESYRVTHQLVLHLRYKAERMGDGRTHATDSGSAWKLLSAEMLGLNSVLRNDHRHQCSNTEARSSLAALIYCSLVVYMNLMMLAFPRADSFPRTLKLTVQKCQRAPWSP